jgi:hypothetical protein
MSSGCAVARLSKTAPRDSVRAVGPAGPFKSGAASKSLVASARVQPIDRMMKSSSLSLGFGDANDGALATALLEGALRALVAAILWCPTAECENTEISPVGCADFCASDVRCPFPFFRFVGGSKTGK